MSLKLTAVDRILCLGAHADDIEIGCGGAMLRLIRDNPDCEVHWVVFSANEIRRQEAEAAARHFLAGALRSQVQILDFRDGYFPSSYAQLKDAFFEIRSGFQPDLVFTHRVADAHQDHRILAELTWQTFRQQLILEYEIPKYEGDLLPPNFFIGLDRADCDMKLRLLRESFKSQAAKGWFTDATFEALLRLRGVESQSSTGLAEGFHASKLTI